MKKELTESGAFASVAISNNDGYQQDGLTKREYFTAMAMQGLLAGGRFYDLNSLTSESIEIADAILEKL